MQQEAANIYDLKNILENTNSRVIVIYNGEDNSNLNIKQNKKRQENIKFTEREKEVLKHIAAGESNTEIAEKLFISVHTAKAHVCNIMQKIGVNDRVRAAVYAVKNNLA